MKSLPILLVLAYLWVASPAAAQNQTWRVTQLSFQFGGIYAPYLDLPIQNLRGTCPSCPLFQPQYAPYQIATPKYNTLPHEQPIGQISLGLQKRTDSLSSQFSQRSSLQIGAMAFGRFIGRANFFHQNVTPIDTFTSATDGMDYSVDSISYVVFSTNSQNIQLHLQAAWLYNLYQSSRFQVNAGLSLSAGITLDDFTHSMGTQGYYYREKDLITGIQTPNQQGPYPNHYDLISSGHFHAPRFASVVSLPVSISVALGEMNPQKPYFAVSYQLQPAYAYLRYSSAPMIIQQMGFKVVFPEKQGSIPPRN